MLGPAWISVHPPPPKIPGTAPDADVRWLSRAKVLVRFSKLLSEIRAFTTSKHKEYPQLMDPVWLLNFAFLTDISQHLNTLNETLQGGNKTLPVMFQKIEAFQNKLSLFSAHIATCNLTHFSHLATMVMEVDPNKSLLKEQKFGENMQDLARQFETRFSECRLNKSLFQFVLEPFSFDVNRLCDFVMSQDLGESQLALLELQNDTYLSKSPDVNRSDCLVMWKSISAFHSYSMLANTAKRVLCMFGSTYRCESAFSVMSGIKNKARNRITNEHLQDCVRAATTKYTPRFSRLVNDKQCHGSH
jgi:hypothetical protein